jgi:hypothetical protein
VSDWTSSGPVELDEAGLSTLKSYLNTNYKIDEEQGTALFYADHKAIQVLKAREDDYPDDLDSVNLVTFTDGLDNTSIGLSVQSPLDGKTFDTNTQYADYIQSEITDSTIAGKSITAYSVGIQGADVTDYAGFSSALQKLASADKSYLLTDYAELQATFATIADSCVSVTMDDPLVSFDMTTTLLPAGTKVRVTFDILSNTGDPTTSTQYIEGTVQRSGSGASVSYTLTNITYGTGISSAQGAGPIAGTLSGSTVSYAFTDLTGYNPSSATYQWTMAPDSTVWQVNSEYSASGDTEYNASVDRKSSVICLVLDASKSLSTSQIESTRTTVIDFITLLHNNYYGEVLLPEWTTGTIGSNSKVYTFPVTAGNTYSVRWKDYDNGNYSYADIVVSGSGVSSWSATEGTNGGTICYYNFTATRSGTQTVTVTRYSDYYGSSSSSSSSTTFEIMYTSTPPIPLTTTFTNDTLTAGDSKSYSFPVTAGTTYSVSWVDYDDSGSSYADIAVSGSGVSGWSATNGTDGGTIRYHTFTPTTSGTQFVIVTGNSSYRYGTFKINYETLQTLTTTFTNDTLTAGDSKIYTFPVTAGTRYSVRWKDSGVSSGYADIKVSGSGVSSWSATDGTYSSSDGSYYYTFTPTTSGTQTVTVTGYSTSSSGTFEIMYTSTPIPTTPLTTTFTYDTLTAGDSKVYTFPVTAGTEYGVAWVDKDVSGNSSYADIKVSGSGVSSWSATDGTDGGSIRYYTFTPTTSGTQFVVVTGYSSTSSGTFGIGLRGN